MQKCYVCYLPYNNLTLTPSWHKATECSAPQETARTLTLQQNKNMSHDKSHDNDIHMTQCYSSSSKNKFKSESRSSITCEYVFTYFNMASVSTFKGAAIGCCSMSP